MPECPVVTCETYVAGEEKAKCVKLTVPATMITGFKKNMHGAGDVMPGLPPPPPFEQTVDGVRVPGLPGHFYIFDAAANVGVEDRALHKFVRVPGEFYSKTNLGTHKIPQHVLQKMIEMLQLETNDYVTIVAAASGSPGAGYKFEVAEGQFALMVFKGTERELPF
jgi:hypothetical protein